MCSDYARFQKLASKFSKAKCKTCDTDCLGEFPKEEREALKITGFPTFIGFVEGVEVGRVIGAPRGGDAELETKCHEMKF